MVFEEKSIGVTFKNYTGIMDRHIYLDSERVSNLSKIQAVYEKEVLRKDI